MMNDKSILGDFDGTEIARDTANFMSSISCLIRTNTGQFLGNPNKFNHVTLDDIEQMNKALCTIVEASHIFYLIAGDNERVGTEEKE